jgi:tetratricopeptide (TPR) repeat protein/transcriptional regulator with XRE-family HTH domain
MVLAPRLDQSRPDALAPDILAGGIVMKSLADPRDSSLVASLLVRTIHRERGGTLDDVARSLGLSERTLRRWARGTHGASPKHLDFLARKAGYSPALIHGVVRLLGLLRLAEAGQSAEGSPTPARPFFAEVIAVATRAVEEAHELLPVEPAPESWEAAEIPAEELWRRFTSRDRAQQKRLVRESAVFHTCGFCERLCNESVAVAPDSPAEALEVAVLAVDVARKIRGSASRRAATEAYALGHLGNARRVFGNDLTGADAEFSRARQLLSTCESNELSRAARSRLLDLEASLRRAQRLFPEALALLKDALALGPEETKGRILLNKAATLELKGDHELALAALAEAKPFVEAHGTLRDRFALRFNAAVALCNLRNAEEAENLLPEIRALAERLNKAHDSLRTRWLEARVAAGLGRTEEAIAGIGRVCEEFLHTDPPLPYDAALAGLDLALYWLQEGNTAAVQRLAVPLERIFRAKGIRREALGSLRLFCDAARCEAATLELVEKIKADVERAGRSQ